MTLTDTQLVLLSAASQREDGGIELARKGTADRVVGKLLSQGAPPKLQGEQPYAEPLV
jgi:hypothetical protein